MSAAAVVAARYPRVTRTVRGWIDGGVRIGEQTQFYGRTIVSIGDALVHYKTETLRLVAQMGLGSGALALIGGSVAVVGFLTMMTGSLVAVQGYNQLAATSVEALTGFASAFFNVRLISPLTAAIALAATIGAGATAQLGAMRINEEIDALEVMGIRPIAYLASTRVAAGIIVAVPLMCIALVLGWISGDLVATALYGQANGVYDHYFNTFLNPADALRGFVVTVAEVATIMLIHTYYGFNAAGGPAGVGTAVGRATRTSLLASSFVIMF